MFFLFTLFYTINNILYISASSNYHHRDGLHVPCSFFDTVNVTGDQMFRNGSYLHDGVIIPDYLVGRYDYIYKDLVRREEVSPHFRGCICKIKPCISLCCPWGTLYNTNISSCVNATDGYEWPDPTMNITLSDGGIQSINIFEYFAVQNFRPCSMMFSLIPAVYGVYDKWMLFENGTLLRTFDEVMLKKNEFCLAPTIINETDTVYVINPANCNTNPDFGTMKLINSFAMLFSIPFMILTIIVYLTIAELRNHHGKSLVCYLLGLIVGYSLISSIAFMDKVILSPVPCKAIGYTAYFFFMAAFFWLNVISFDLWHNFRDIRGMNRSHEKKRFVLYSIYAWGMAVFFLIFTIIAQEVIDIPDYYKPGIGAGEFCWLDMRTWSTMIYFFGPILLIILANVIMFVMTAVKIHRVQREMARIISHEDSTKNLRTERDKFGLFLRLFIVMGVTWSLEILSYFVGSDKVWAKIFYISDFCNSIQGFLIFMLFVMKKKVKYLIQSRCFSSSKENNQRQSQYSTKTISSSFGNLTLIEKNNVNKPQCN